MYVGVYVGFLHAEYDPHHVERGIIVGNAGQALSGNIIPSLSSLIIG